HVRAYNAAWDYYKGMTPGEIETELRRDTSWQRPTWPLGRLGTAGWEEELLRDPIHLLASRRRPGAAGRSSDTPADLREPLATLGLSWPVTLPALKARYKELAKRHHPDANGGDRAAEERLKIINLAYAALRSRLASEPRLAAVG
ncbi:MAG: J domain-containing protein, partial [Acetobacteraceae bacterium]